MRFFMRRGVLAFTAIALAIIFATPAMAIISTGRSEEMIFQSPCDKAGTFEFKFSRDDIEIMARYLPRTDENGVERTPRLNDGEVYYDVPRPGDPGGIAEDDALGFITLRVSLAALNINNPVENLVLCKSISGDGSDYRDALGRPFKDNVVPLRMLGVEVSDVTTLPGYDGGGVICDTVGGNFADVEAYVYGENGADFFTIYIVDIATNRYRDDPNNPVDDWANQNNWPWIKVGLTPDQLISCAPQPRDTSICVNVSGFDDGDDLATVNVNVDIEPEELTYTTSDSQIGHFKAVKLETLDCTKAGQGDCYGQDTEYIELCAIDKENPDEQGKCDYYYQCIIVRTVENTSWPLAEELRLILHSMPSGVYLNNVSVLDDNGSPMDIDYYYYSSSASLSNIVNSLYCTFSADYYVAEFDENAFEDTNYIQICITYQVNKNPEDGDVPEAGDNVQFSIDIEKLGPCPTSVLDELETFTGAEFKPCGQMDTCMYFPYIVANFSPWGTGVAITNLSDKVAVEDMKVHVQLRDKEGVILEKELPDSVVTGKVFSFNVDALAEKLEWALPEGNSLYWLWVTANFPMDGYSFLCSGEFGAGTLPRLLEACPDEYNDISDVITGLR